ncbi:hypothetical protein [Limoniibacter endophyticus]|uniref:Flagellar FliJ protein n=1 Tax=Limoniibacter endophyticus TaxID=1565040 RepID=A0A8J3DGC1_9HYPH|nr:hypothetical protein [Limoniibacter endophyticus]GHC64440.1 hypothetical protein GCM10010136_06390 [Limoniibacter endophyticus]
MRNDPRKLARLVKLQRQVEQLHAARQGQLLAQKLAAEKEAGQLIEQANRGGTTAQLFPELYYRHINECAARGVQKGEAAAIEGETRATVRRRAERLEEKLVEARRNEERQREECENLERIQNTSVKIAARFKQV